MFGLKLFKRHRSPVARHSSPPAAPVAQGWHAPVPRASAGPPPPPPPPEAFLAGAVPALPLSSTPAPFSVSGPEAGGADPVDAPPPGVPKPARVRFFYSDGTVSEPDAQEAERLGYLATNLLEASRDDLP